MFLAPNNNKKKKSMFSLVSLSHLLKIISYTLLGVHIIIVVVLVIFKNENSLHYNIKYCLILYINVLHWVTMLIIG